jgi:hypothetical protein
MSQSDEEQITMVDATQKESEFAAIMEFLFHFSFFMIFLIPWTTFIGGFISMVILGNTFSPAENRVFVTVMGSMFTIAMLVFVLTGEYS